MSFVNQYRSTTIYGELKVQKYNTGNINGLLDISGNTILRGDCTINGNLLATDGTIDISGNLNVTGSISGKLAINDTNNTNDFFKVPFLDTEGSSSTLSSNAGLQYNPISEVLNYGTLNGGDILALDISANNVNAANFIGNISTGTDSTNASFFPTFVSAAGNAPLKVSSGISYNPFTETLDVTNINGTITNNSTTSTVTPDNSLGTFYPTFVSATSGNLPLKSDEGISYNPSLNILSTSVSKVVITPDSTDTDLYIPFVTATSGNRELLADIGLRFNPADNMLTVDNATIVNMTGTSSQVVITNTTDNVSYRVPFSLVSNGNCPLGSDPGLTYNPSSNLLTTTVSNVNVTNTTTGSYRVPFALTTTGSVALGSDAGLTYDASNNLLSTTVTKVSHAVAPTGLFPIALADQNSLSQGNSSINTDAANFYYNTLTKELILEQLQSTYMRTPLSGVWLVNGNNTNSLASIVPLFCSQTNLADINDQSSLTLEAAVTASGVTGTLVNPFNVTDTTDLVIIMPKWGIRGHADIGYSGATRINVHNQYDIPIYVTPSETNSISSCRIYFNRVQITGQGS